MQPVCDLISLGFSTHSAGMPRAIEAQVLRVCVDFDALHGARVSASDALTQLQLKGYDESVLTALSALVTTENAGRLADVSFIELRDGMVLAEDLYSATGTLMLARGHSIKGNVIDRLRAMRPSLGNRGTVRVRLPD
jgi:hypothetical protein